MIWVVIGIVLFVFGLAAYFFEKYIKKNQLRKKLSLH